MTIPETEMQRINETVLLSDSDVELLASASGERVRESYPLKELRSMLQAQLDRTADPLLRAVFSKYLRDLE